jgi:uncharacterized Fe-S center protein
VSKSRLIARRIGIPLTEVRVEETAGRTLGALIRNKKLDPRCQIRHAEGMGLGSSTYELVQID